jgi:hypothetical protein
MDELLSKGESSRDATSAFRIWIAFLVDCKRNHALLRTISLLYFPKKEYTRAEKPMTTSVSNTSVSKQAEQASLSVKSIE